MHLTRIEDMDLLPEPKRSQVKALYKLAEEMSELGIVFIMGYAMGGDVGAVGNLRPGDPVPRMMKEIGSTITREVPGAQVTVVSSGNN